MLQEILKWVAIALCAAGCAYFIHRAQKLKAEFFVLQKNREEDAYFGFAAFVDELEVTLNYAAGASLVALAVVIGAWVR